jgi:hypothetical protein
LAVSASGRGYPVVRTHVFLRVELPNIIVVVLPVRRPLWTILHPDSLEVSQLASREIEKWRMVTGLLEMLG